MTVEEARAMIARRHHHRRHDPQAGGLHRRGGGGVEGVVILDGRVPHAMLLELFTEHGVGTLVERDYGGESRSPRPRRRGAFRRHAPLDFDLDNTLYPSECNLFAEIDRRMSAFIQYLLGPIGSRAPSAKGAHYEHGTTLSGLMPSSRESRKLSWTMFTTSTCRRSSSARSWPKHRRPDGRKFIFTNGSVRHAERVADQLGVLDVRWDLRYRGGRLCAEPKPEAFERFLDIARALIARPRCSRTCRIISSPAHALGIVTVLVQSDYMDHPSQYALKEAVALAGHIQFETGDLTGFLNEVAAAANAAAEALPLPRKPRQSKARARFACEQLRSEQRVLAFAQGMMCCLYFISGGGKVAL